MHNQLTPNDLAPSPQLTNSLGRSPRHTSRLVGTSRPADTPAPQPTLMSVSERVAAAFRLVGQRMLARDGDPDAAREVVKDMDTSSALHFLLHGR